MNLDEIVKLLIGSNGNVHPTLVRRPKKAQRPWCSNIDIHNGRKYLHRIYRWGGRIMCKRCYKHYCRNVKLIR